MATMRRDDENWVGDGGSQDGSTTNCSGTHIVLNI